jgi:hypothetical protein
MVRIIIPVKIPLPSNYFLHSNEEEGGEVF